MKNRHTVKHTGDALEAAFADLVATTPTAAAIFKDCTPLSWREDHYHSGLRRYRVRGRDATGMIIEMKVTAG